VGEFNVWKSSNRINIFSNRGSFFSDVGGERGAVFFPRDSWGIAKLFSPAAPSAQGK
jgi:hypothetical protein